MSLGTSTFDCWSVGRASRLPSNDLRTPARRPRYIQKSKSKLLLVSVLDCGVDLEKEGELIGLHL